MFLDDESLSSVVDRVNRYGGTQIVIIASPEVGAMKTSAVCAQCRRHAGFCGNRHALSAREGRFRKPHTIALENAPKKNGI